MGQISGNGGELPPSLLLPVLEGVDVEVDGAVECGQQVAEAGHVGQPGGPGYFCLDMVGK